MATVHPPAAVPLWQELALPFWQLFTRLGEAQLLLPALLLAALWLARRPGGARLAGFWLAATGVAALITTATKVAFIGYGIGYAPLNFTGISGHAMFAAAVLPPLVLLAGRAWAQAGPRALLGLGYGLAAAVAVSRVMVGVHSWTEVTLGFTLGALASGAALASATMPAARLARWVPAALLAWAMLGAAAAPPSNTHDLVTQLALAQSGRAKPYQRWEMHRDFRRRAAQAGTAAVSLQPR